MTERKKLVELMARAMCAGQGLNWEDQFSIRSSNGDPLAHEAFKHDAEAALTALESAGVRLVPVLPTDQMLIDAGTIEGYENDPRCAADQDHIDWWTAMLAASPYAPEGTRND